jgi:hypothetical protein
MSDCKEKYPVHFSDIGKKRKEKLYRISKMRGKSFIQLFRDWIDGMKEK